MGMEKRKGRAYYYRKRRIGKRIVSEYVGTGPEAEKAAAEDRVRQANQQELRAILKKQREQEMELDAAAAHVCSVIDTAVGAVLEAAGFHKHKGQWRQRHASPKNRARP